MPTAAVCIRLTSAKFNVTTIHAVTSVPQVGASIPGAPQPIAPMTSSVSELSTDVTNPGR